ncbi:MAG: molybdopterin-dependent oxidoreductase [Isosphaeraceae bacterium]
MDLTRRQWLGVAASAGAGLLPVGCTGRPEKEATGRDEDVLAQFPGKVAMRVVNDRPPCLETPWRYFQHDFTPNEAFYVRSHLQAVPAAIDVNAWRLRIEGTVDRPLELSMRDLERLGTDEVVAVNQCSGNSRSLFGPRVPGAQWRHGAMGNARWAGVGLAKVLRAAGVRRDAVQVAFDGLDEGPLASVPDFVKALKIDHALQPEVMVAYSMNGEALPALNGFPARLVVPGWYATYWVKALHRITVLPHVFEGYWMAKAYKIPANPNGVEDPHATLTDHLIPINRMNVRSFVTTPEPGAKVPVGRTIDVEGIAFDGGSGVRCVEVSVDGGSTWAGAVLGDDLGRYSFRRWRYAWSPASTGAYRLRSRATAGDGQVQPDKEGWNRSGFMRNTVEEMSVHVA